MKQYLLQNFIQWKNAVETWLNILEIGLTFVIMRNNLPNLRKCQDTVKKLLNHEKFFQRKGAKLPGNFTRKVSKT